MTTILFALLATAAFADGSVTLPTAEVVTIEGIDDWTWKYEVASGDTASQLAYDFGSTLDELERINPGIDLDRIDVGQMLRFPEYEEDCGC